MTDVAAVIAADKATGRGGVYVKAACERWPAYIAAVEAIQALHRPCTEVEDCRDSETGFCHECERCWPCPTVRALDLLTTDHETQEATT